MQSNINLVRRLLIAPPKHEPAKHEPVFVKEANNLYKYTIIKNWICHYNNTDINTWIKTIMGVKVSMELVSCIIQTFFLCVVGNEMLRLLLVN